MNTLKLAASVGLALLLTGQGLAVQAAEPPTVELTFLSTTDVHGHVWPTTYYTDQEKAMGLAKVYTLVKKFRAENPHTLLVDSGDMLQGSPLPYVQAKVHGGKGANPMIQAMNAMGYDVFGVGNHDFNFGIPHLRKAEAEAKFPFVVSNIYKAGTQEPFFRPFVIKEMGGVKVGVIGFAPPGIVLWDKAHVGGKIEVVSLLAAAERWIPEMKRQGADVIVAVPHAGLGGKYGPEYSGYSPASGLPPENVGTRLAMAFPEIDVMFTGHSHQEIKRENINGVAIAQAKMWAERLALAKVKLTREGGKWKVVTKTTDVLNLEAVPAAPEVLAATRPAHDATVAYVHSPIARTAVDWSAKDSILQDSPIIDLINEVQRSATGAQLASAASFNLDAVLKKGEITIADIASLYPYENGMVAIKVTGKQLKEYLEHSARYFLSYEGGSVKLNPEIRAYNYDMVSGVDYRIDLGRPAGDRIVGLSYQGKPVTDAQTFTMAINSYRQGGGGGYEMLKDCPLIYDRQESIRELIIEYLKQKQKVDPKDVFKKNWELVAPSAR